MKDFEAKVAEETAAELSAASTAAAVAATPEPVTAADYVLKTIDKSKIVP